MSFLHFTTQQLQGGGKYNTKCKIGNWYEDMELEEIKFKDYLKRKEDSKLLVSSKENKYSSSLKRLKLEQCPIKNDYKLLVTDHYFAFQNAKTKGFLVADIDDKNPNHDMAFAVTTNPAMDFACPRNLFKFEKYEKSDDNIIKYGEKICLVTHDELSKEKLYLYSQLISPQSYSRFSRNQEVLVNSKRDYSTCWVIEFLDPINRVKFEGQPIILNEAFIIRHCQTGRLLASDLIDYNNDYGREFEVCCFNFMSSNKYQTLISEKVGTLKIDTKTKVELDNNIWRVVDEL